MTDHVLLPAQALPGLLQSGLPVIRGRRESLATEQRTSGGAGTP